jgi:hypothetical protein
MGNEADNEHRSQRISGAFAFLTAKLEDAATIAVEGQGRHPDDKLCIDAEKIAELAGEACTVAGALAVLLAGPPNT